MRFEVRINQSLEHSQPVLVVLLFTKKDEDYLNGCEDGIYNCASTMPDDKKALVNVIEQSVNACLDYYEKEIEKVLREIVSIHKPKIDQFMDMCFPHGVPFSEESKL